MYECLKCGLDLEDLVGWNTLTDDFIACPKCGHKMTVEYDESYNDDTGEELCYFWVEDYEENNYEKNKN